MKYVAQRYITRKVKCDCVQAQFHIRLFVYVTTALEKRERERQRKKNQKKEPDIISLQIKRTTRNSYFITPHLLCFLQFLVFLKRSQTKPNPSWVKWFVGVLNSDGKQTFEVDAMVGKSRDFSKSQIFHISNARKTDKPTHKFSNLQTNGIVACHSPPNFVSKCMTRRAFHSRSYQKHTRIKAQ